MARRPVRLGLDYGTSTSKLLLRDLVGRDRLSTASPVLLDGEFRIPSSVLIRRNRLLFGRKSAEAGDTQLHSVKMFAAQEVRKDLYALAPASLPSGLTYCDVVVLTLWWLLGHARETASERFRVRLEEVALDFALGAPMHFTLQEDTRKAFLLMAARASSLLKTRGPIRDREISIDEAMRAVDEVKRTYTGTPNSSLLCSEAQAAAWYTFRSPHAEDGPCIKVDVGAGTTNVSLFRLRQGKEIMTVFGTSAASTGMDNVLAALAANQRNSDPIALRGRENELLKKEAARTAVEPVLNQLREVMRQGWRNSFPKIRHAGREKAAWESDARVVFVGGGTEVKLIREKLIEHPSRDADSPLKPLPLQKPNDLDFGRLSPAYLPFMLVAYGLSDPDMEVQELQSPDTIQELAPVRHKARCGCGNFECDICAAERRA